MLFLEDFFTVKISFLISNFYYYYYYLFFIFHLVHARLPQSDLAVPRPNEESFPLPFAHQHGHADHTGAGVTQVEHFGTLGGRHAGVEKSDGSVGETLNILEKKSK